MSLDDNRIRASAIRSVLTRLETERLEAKSLGLDACQMLIRELDEEIAACRSMYVLAVVTEIAVLRAEMFGRQVG
jgi:hypothetical protein